MTFWILFTFQKYKSENNFNDTGYWFVINKHSVFLYIIDGYYTLCFDMCKLQGFFFSLGAERI